MTTTMPEQPSITTVTYRIVLKGYEATTGISQVDETVDETDRTETIEIILSGTRPGSPSDAQHWTAKELDFSDDDTVGLGKEVFESYSYCLQILQDGTWHDIKTLHPTPSPFEPCATCDRADCDGGCVYDGWGPDDEVTTDEVRRRAYAHTRNPELANEAASLYPGDYM